MSVNGVNGVNGSQPSNGANRLDYKELEVARKLVAAGLISSVQEFQNLSEAEKQEKVQAYNKTHPNDPIEDKKTSQAVNKPEKSQQSGNGQGSEMTKFINDVDWKKVKLQ